MNRTRFTTISVLIVLILGFTLPYHAFALPEREYACNRCHTPGGTVISLSVNTTSLTVTSGQPFHLQVNATLLGESVTWIVKWPSEVKDNALFLIDPTETAIYTESEFQSNIFTIIPPAETGEYELRVYVTGKSSDNLYTKFEDISVMVAEKQTSTTTTTETIVKTTETVVTTETVQKTETQEARTLATSMTLTIPERFYETQTVPLIIAAKVVAEDGAPVPGIRVHFFVNTTFGQLELGSALTDLEGVATLSSTYRLTGPTQITAIADSAGRFRGSNSTAILLYQAKEVATDSEALPFVQGQNRLLDIRLVGVSLMPTLFIIGVAILIIGGVWGTFSFVLYLIYRIGKDKEKRSDNHI